MYIVRRKEGEWVEVTSRSGDVLRIAIGRPTRGERGRVGSAELVFDDPERRFEIRRPEAEVVPRPEAEAPEPKAFEPLPDCYCRQCALTRLGRVKLLGPLPLV